MKGILFQEISVDNINKNYCSPRCKGFKYSKKIGQTKCKYTDTILEFIYDYFGFKRCDKCLNNVMLIDK